ncbi:unnamed protein product [Kluyveromyces dobzhanskii CBS 2104]|uniref:WGS project CCBQ000000000 data, contig 00016 n=1 Tax=Kluyveromyces dobzhanskii CBS 2104 TaxID=1427455 RepID=A0A0A8L2F7_9SACH|nr:unnamed protein product [Kluyveromyces dobzhanskii CBS 2104]
MSKRFAGSQMTREGLEKGRDENISDDDTPFEKPSIASDSVMSSRKIAMPKRKMAGFNTGDKPNFKVTKSETKTHGKDENEKIAALNSQFKDKVNSTLVSDPVADLSSLFDKYKGFLQKLRSGSEPNAVAKAAPISTPSFSIGGPSTNTEKPKNPFAFAKPAPEVAPPAEAPKPAVSIKQDNEKKIEAISDSDGDSEDEKPAVTVNGPKFVLTKQPTTSDPPFSFGGNKRKEPDSDSESEVEIKGPQFTFTGTVSSDTFKLPKKDTPGTVESKQETVEATDKQPASIFGNSSQTKPAFPSFGSNNTGATNTSSPFSFSFNDGGKDSTKNESSKDDVKSAATFGTASAAGETLNPKPSFSFTAPASKENTEIEDKPKTSLTLGSSSKEKDTDVTKKPSFTFGAPATSENATESTKPSFTFGSATSSTTPSFSFGKQESEKNDEKKPTFTFGAAAASSVPAFSFGTKKTGDASSNGGSSGFKFSLPFAPSNSNSDKENGKETTEQKSEAAPEEITEEPSKALNLSNGEENETLIFSQRAKLMIFNTETKAYDSRGVGELKILQSKEDNTKARILCRSDGMGHILLNTSIVKSFSYEPLDPNNENLVKCPAVKAEGGLDTYVIKVKQKADGRKLVQAIKDAQSPM